MGDSNVQIANATKFTIDLKGGSETPDGNWYRIQGGAMNLHRVNKTTSNDPFQLEEAGDIEFTELELTGPFVKAQGTRKDMLDWLNSWATGKGMRENGTITLLDSTDTTVRTIQIYDIMPVAYYPPAVDVRQEGELLEERIRFKCGRIEDG